MTVSKSQLVLRFLVVAGMFIAFAAPASADTVSTTTPLVVTLQETGSFAVSLGTYIGFTPGTVTATTGFTSKSTVVLRFDDTMSYRSQFRVDLLSSDFVSLKRVPYAPFGTFYKIAASNLTVSKNFSPEQAQYAADTPGVGDILATDQAGNTIPVGSSVVWTAGNGLETPRKVAKGMAGIGTILAGQGIELTLNVPAGMPPTYYNAVLTATVTFEAP